MTRRAIFRPFLPLLILALAGMSAAFVVVPGANASTEPVLDASCYFEEEIITSPGLTMEPQPYSYASAAPGVVLCAGTIGGKPITGPGWFLDEGKGFGNCLGGSGYSRLEGAVPVAGGEEIPITGNLHLQRVGVTGELHGYVNDGFYTGTYEGTPSETEPSTEPRCSDDPPPSSRAFVRGFATIVVAEEAVTAPAPHSLTARVTRDAVKLSWGAADEALRPRIEGFEVYRDGWLLTTLGADARTFVDEGLDAGTYTYEVTAIGTPFESAHTPPVTAHVRYRAR